MWATSGITGTVRGHSEPARVYLIANEQREETPDARWELRCCCQLPCRAPAAITDECNVCIHERRG